MNGAVGQSARVLVVRSDALRDRVAAAMAGARLDVQVESSPSYLSAMGWLTHEKVDVVIGPVSAMTGMVGSTARALRKLAPGTRLVAVATEKERAEAGAALNAGFDQCVFEPADATALLASLRLVVPNDSAVVVEPDEQAELTAPVSDGYNPSVPHVSHAAHDPHTNHGADDAKGESPSSGASGFDWLKYAFDDPAPLQARPGMGDVDLAEAVMRGDRSLLPIALGVLREQSGLTDAQFIPADDPADIHGASCEVAFAGEVFGRLASHAVDEQALGSWAAWLSRWLAMDRRHGELYEEAMHDELTGLWNRRYFDRFLEGVIGHAAQGRQQVTLMVFDIDNFKLYNDNYGHPAGDEILKATASLIQSLVREHDVVARIGGDEFAVVFWDKGEPRHLGSQHPDNVIGIAKRFQKAIWEHRFPKLGKEAIGHLTVSGGLAGFPWDGRTARELLARADAMAIQSKRQGKNVICFGPGAAPNGNGHSHA